MLWVLAILCALIFSFGYFAIPVGIGAFIYFNALLAAVFYVSRKTEQNKDLPKTRESQMVIGIFTFF